MPHFTTPVVYIEPRFHHDDPPSVKRVRRFFRPSPTGINLWLLKSGEVTALQPVDNSVVEREFLGARRYTVTEAEAALLSGAGYTVDE